MRLLPDLLFTTCSDRSDWLNKTELKVSFLPFKYHTRELDLLGPRASGKLKLVIIIFSIAKNGRVKNTFDD